MKDENQNRRSTHDVAEEYFDYMGRHLPQQCASDEFYFLPRAEAAITNLDELDDLHHERIQDHVGYVRALLREMTSEETGELEEEIDGILVIQSMKSFLREFEDYKVWQKDPSLYMKIVLFRADYILSKKDVPADKIREDLFSFFQEIPPYLRLGIENLHLPSEIARGISLNMVRDAIGFFHNNIPAFITEKLGEDEGLIAKNKEVLESLKEYGNSLNQLPTKDAFGIGEEGLREILSVSLSYSRSPAEILVSARDSYKNTQDKLSAISNRIDTTRRWDQIIYENSPSIGSHEELLEIYKREVKALRGFFYAHDSMTFPSGEEVCLLKTPSYLQSFKATASYRAPLTGNTKGYGIFYITPGNENLGMIASHSPYLSAHETYPGHHILDHNRIHHSNPIRRQIESPLFYEGWACYGELLLDELGYITDPRRQLIGLKRQLWRNLRAVLDVELQTGKTSLAQAAHEIEAIGFPAGRAKRQVERFALSPGYQSCYSMGMHEILKLREKYASKLGLKTFHDILLGGGQLPFHLVERRLEVAGSGLKSG